MLRAAFEQVERRAGILAHGASRVFTRAGRIRDAREVEDGVAAVDQLARRGVACVAAYEPFLIGARAFGPAGAREAHDVVAGFFE